MSEYKPAWSLGKTHPSFQEQESLPLVIPHEGRKTGPPVPSQGKEDERSTCGSADTSNHAACTTKLFGKGNIMEISQCHHINDRLIEPTG